MIEAIEKEAGDVNYRGSDHRQLCDFGMSFNL